MKRLCIFFLLSVLVLSVSCSVTRTMTTTQTSIKGQDTVVIQTTRSVESYDATIKPKM